MKFYALINHSLEFVNMKIINKLIFNTSYYCLGNADLNKYLRNYILRTIINFI